ncbi:hypothetical protein B0H13DRAFT_2035144, partial [Mycena leptocephala]
SWSLGAVYFPGLIIASTYQVPLSSCRNASNAVHGITRFVHMRSSFVFRTPSHPSNCFADKGRTELNASRCSRVNQPLP